LNTFLLSRNCSSLAGSRGYVSLRHGYGNGQTDEGRAYVYTGTVSGLSDTPDWTAESDQTNARFGRAVGTAGDVNGDGYSDVIVGAYYYDNGQTDEGRACVYTGTATGVYTVSLAVSGPCGSDTLTHQLYHR